jgi:hypothetical protein
VSNFLAIATVTAALGQILQNAIQADVPGAKVSNVRPDGVGSGTTATGANIYLYRITPNAAQCNSDLPTRRQDGTLVKKPRAALDLHYLLTFYGQESILEPQMIMGSVVRTLHARPLITKKDIENVKAGGGPLGGTDLNNEMELVKFTPVPLSLEELAKIWSVFYQLPYNLSVAYSASTVFIESDDKPEAALPVRHRAVHSLPFSHAKIEMIESEDGSNSPIVAGSLIYIFGKNLKNDLTSLRVGAVEVIPQEIDDAKIGLLLSSPPFPAGFLRAGLYPITVMHKVLMGMPPVPHKGVESNVSAFVLRPKTTVTSVHKSSRIVNGINIIKADLTATFDPPAGIDQRGVLLLNELNPPADRHAWAYSFNIDLNEPGTVGDTKDHATVSDIEVAEGEYLVRVQVDGAESPLQESSDPNNPRYVGPTVTVS